MEKATNLDGHHGPRRQYENAVCQCQGALELALRAEK